MKVYIRVFSALEDSWLAGWSQDGSGVREWWGIHGDISLMWFCHERATFQGNERVFGISFYSNKERIKKNGMHYRFKTHKTNRESVFFSFMLFIEFVFYDTRKSLRTETSVLVLYTLTGN